MGNYEGLVKAYLALRSANRGKSFRYASPRLISYWAGMVLLRALRNDAVRVETLPLFEHAA
jgi:hypothetical protein